MRKRKKETRRFIQGVGIDTWKDLVKEAKDRDISIQALIQTEIIPYWLNSKVRRKSFYEPDENESKSN